MGQNDVVEWLKNQRIKCDKWFSIKQICEGMRTEFGEKTSSKYHNVCISIFKLRSMKKSPLEYKFVNKLTSRDNWMLYRYKKMEGE